MIRRTYTQRGLKWGRADMFLTESFPLFLFATVLYFAAFIDAQSSAGIPTEPYYAVSVAAASGFLSCSILEAAKRLFRLRGWYQRRQVRVWLSGRMSGGSHRIRRLQGEAAVVEFLLASGVIRDESRERAGEGGPPTVLERTFHDILDEMLLFDLPIEQLTAQVSEAVEAAIRAPGKYPVLFDAMVGTSRPALEALSSTKNNEDRHRLGWSRQQPRVDEDDQVEAVLRARQSVDLLQISVGRRWRRYISGTALALSGTCGLLFSVGTSASLVSIVLVTTFAGGFLSWVIRDVSAGLERWRRVGG